MNRVKEFLNKDIKDWQLYVLIALIYTGFLMAANVIFGLVPGIISNDWFSQHLPFIEQIRYNFQVTGELFPQLNMNLGMFQSFTTLYYHGMYNPYILLSFLVPFIPSYIWIQIIGLIIVTLTSIFSNKLFKQWEIPNGPRIILVAMSAFMPVILFNISRHLMYIYYIPFLFLNLYATRILIEENKRGLYLISLLGISYTSYFVLPLVYIINVLYIYVLYSKKLVTISWKKFGSYFLINVIFVLLSVFVLLPQAIEIISGTTRIENPEFFTYYQVDTFKIIFNVQNMQTFLPPTLYSFILVATVWLLKKKDAFAVFPILLLISMVWWPLNYVFNVFQYASDKINIVFSAILILTAAYVIKEASKKTLKKMLIASVIVSLIACYFTIAPYEDAPLRYLYIEVGIIITSFLIYISTYKRVNSLLWATLIAGGIFTLFGPPSFLLIKESLLLSKIQEGSQDAIIQPYRVYNDGNNQFDINAFGTTNYASIQNDYYYQFVNNENVSQSRNYRSRIITDNRFWHYLLGIGAEADNVRPIIYGVADRDIYANSVQPTLDKYQLTISFINGVFTESSDNTDYQPLTYNQVETPSAAEIKSEQTIVLNDEPVEEVSLYMVDMSKVPTTECTIDCRVIVGKSVNTVFQNKLNTNYRFNVILKKGDVLTAKAVDEDVQFENINAVAVPYKELMNSAYDFIKPEQFAVDLNDSFTFKMTMPESGMIASTIPYDKGYTVYIDDQEVTTEIVNNYFLGFKIPEGEHQILVTYNIRGFKTGVISFWIGVGMLITTEYVSRRRKKV